MEILVVDIGGSNVKFTTWQKRRMSKFPSGPRITANQVVKRILSVTKNWKYDAVSIGFPGKILHGRITRASSNLGKGWVNFQFQKHFRKPVKIINDAAMQALGSYRDGRMLFLGLGTGLGSTLILDDVIIPLELGQLRYSRRWTLGEVLGRDGLSRLGRKAWEKAIHNAMEHLTAAFRTDYVVIGGGNVERLKRLPRGARRGGNHNAFIGGARLWGVGGAHAKPRKHTWIIT
jgi:polyphosphate glucokinase